MKMPNKKTFIAEVEKTLGKKICKDFDYCNYYKKQNNIHFYTKDGKYLNWYHGKIYDVDVWNDVNDKIIKQVNYEDVDRATWFKHVDKAFVAANHAAFIARLDF